MIDLHKYVYIRRVSNSKARAPYRKMMMNMMMRISKIKYHDMIFDTFYGFIVLSWL